MRVRRERNYLHGDENIRLVRVMFEFEIARNLLVNWTGNKSVDFIHFHASLEMNYTCISLEVINPFERSKFGLSFPTVVKYGCSFCPS